MRAPIRTLCVVALSLLAAHNAFVEAWSQDILPRHQHAWGRFRPGSWKKVRVVTEVFGDEHEVISTSRAETLTTLLRSEAEGVVLKIETTNEIGGKRFSSEPQIIFQPFSQGNKVKTETPAAGSDLTIDGKRFRCQVCQAEFVQADQRTVTRTFYNEQVAPYVLKSESTTAPVSGAGNTVQTTLEVLALEKPSHVLAEVKPTAHLRAVQKHEKGTIRTLLVSAPDVPGGVVSHTSKEMNSHGQVVRQSTLELVDYHGDASPPSRRDTMSRRRLFPLRRR